MNGLKANSVIVRFAGVMLLALVVPFTILLVLTMNRLAAIEREDANQYLSSNLRTVSSTVDQVLRNLEFSHVHMFQDRAFTTGIRRLAPYDYREAYSDFRNITGIRNSISEVAVANAYIHSIYVYSFRAQRMFSSRINWDPAFNHFDGMDVAWLNTYFSNDLRYPWHITGEIREDWTILSSYRDIWTYGDDSPIALVSINVDASSITQQLSEVTPDGVGYVFIMDGNGNVISQERYQDVAFEEIIAHMPLIELEGYFNFQFEGRDLFVSFYTSSYSGFRYVIATSLDQIETSVPVMRQLIALFFLLIALLAVLVMFLAHYYLYTPIRTLYSGMNRLHDGDFTVRLPQSPTSEFDYINRSFNHTVENIRKLINENYANKLVNKEAELRNLQNQLNEHFLYNTLDSIRWLAKKENAPTASDMVFALANFYRLSLSSGKDVIPVSGVLEMLKNYLNIQMYRMRDALSYSIDCEPSLLKQRILKNLLQPIVENAIIHGVSGLDRPGVIEIRVMRQDQWMRIEVRDNGKGFTEEKLEQVRQQLDLQDPYCEHSFALKTIQSQVQIFYGLDIVLHIDTVYGQGSSVWFDLPIVPEGAEHRDETTQDDHCG
ncbi:MAG: histidine kinase [Oscillospiraceae bacterium]|nr:histidine kinase [Oscillospiraceae bacterium]